MSDGGVIGVLARGLAERRDVLSAWVGVNDPAIAEALAREAFDAVTLDLQHGGIDFVDVSQAILAVALAGKPTLARVPVGDFALASRLVDAGAAAVIAPMIDDATTARRFAEHVKFPPLGRRSFGPRAALALTGFVGPAYLLGANAVTLAIAMIEISRSACFARRDSGDAGNRRRVRRPHRSVDLAPSRWRHRS